MTAPGPAPTSMPHAIEPTFQPMRHATLRVSAAFFRAALRIHAESPHVEDGGRIVGFIERTAEDAWTAPLSRVRIEGVIPSGPMAQRALTSLHQDGEWQEEIFRRVERSFPSSSTSGPSIIIAPSATCPS